MSMVGKNRSSINLCSQHSRCDWLVDCCFEALWLSDVGRKRKNRDYIINKVRITVIFKFDFFLQSFEENASLRHISSGPDADDVHE